MIKASILKIILNLAISKVWQIRQADVNNAFLNGKLEEIVNHESVTRLYRLENPNFVYKLEKAPYGLRKAPRA